MTKSLKAFLLILKALLFCTFTSAGAAAEPSREIEAKAIVQTLYTISSMFEQRGMALEGGGAMPTMFRAMLAPELIDEIEERNDKFKPLVGAKEGKVDKKQIRLAKKQPEDNDQILIEASVTSDKDTRLIYFTVGASSAGKPIV
ncbi:MAG: hypothetical protein RIC18_07825 [Hoeflea sp.]|uniref:hypothetical protein n=1 Tax=Hoeflea sp. TaxID=1940281 RepID=UPI0032EB8EE7